MGRRPKIKPANLQKMKELGALSYPILECISRLFSLIKNLKNLLIVLMEIL